MTRARVRPSPDGGPVAVPDDGRRPDGLLRVLVRYALGGALTQVVYLSLIAVALALGMHYLAAIVLAQAIALSFSFPIYRRRVFRSTGPVLPQLVTFLGVWSVGAAMSLVGVPLLVELAGMRPLPAQLVVLVVIFVFSFLSHHKVTFRPR